MTEAPIHHSLIHGSGLNLYQANDLAGLGSLLFMGLWLGPLYIMEYWSEIKGFIYKFIHMYERNKSDSTKKK